VVTRTLTRSWDNADARNRGVRRATAAVFRRYMLKPVGEPYDSTVAYIEAHYLVDGRIREGPGNLWRLPSLVALLEPSWGLRQKRDVSAEAGRRV
jgi:hypothetical protein